MLYRTLFAGAALINAVGAWTPPKEVEEAAKSSHWAVLIAGSSGYGNYRHQADVCHAYQIMIKAPPVPRISQPSLARPTVRARVPRTGSTRTRSSPSRSTTSQTTT